jgi:pilus assembly protein CpaE
MADNSQLSDVRSHSALHTLRVLLLTDAENRAEIRAALDATTEPQLEIREGELATSSQRSADPTDVIMFVFTGGNEPGSIPALGAGVGKPPVRIALMHDRSVHTVRAALRAGADEVLFLPLNQGDLAPALLKISETRRLAEPMVRGKVISLVSVSGGAGVTTLAANCALALAHSMGKKVALVDLDFQSGDLAVVLNVEPERSILDLSEPGERVNSVQIESALTRHSSGIYVLAAPKRIEESEQITAVQVGAVLDVMRQMGEVVIVDIGRHISDTSVLVWERSDELLYVIYQSISAMRGAWRFTDLFGRLKVVGIEPKFVLNRFSARHAITDKHVANTLGRPLLALVPRDEAALEHAIARGEDLWKVAPRSALTRSYEALAHELCSAERRQEKRTGIISKIFGRNGAHPRS